MRQAGHDDALAFALAIGLTAGYQNDLAAKKDVIDPSGDAHSVKSGVKKWQVFLYGLTRFETDTGFTVMNGIGDLLAACIKAFPPTFDEYERDKGSAKQRLRPHMRELAARLQDNRRLSAFINKSLFNGGEVNYLTVKDGDLFRVFLNEDVVRVMAQHLEVCNSTARTATQVPEQKVLFRHNGLNLGELEMRNDSELHYRQIRFNMIRPKVMGLLLAQLPMNRSLNEQVLIHGNATRRFGRWL